MSLKIVILFGLMAVALGSTLPVKLSYDTDDSEWIYGEGDLVPVSDDVVFVRKARSPQGSLSGTFQRNNRDGSTVKIDYNQKIRKGTLSGTFQHNSQAGSSAGIDYNHKIGKNFEVYGGASRNFRFNENNVHAGLRYQFKKKN